MSLVCLIKLRNYGDSLDQDTAKMSGDLDSVVADVRARTMRNLIDLAAENDYDPSETPVMTKYLNDTTAIVCLRKLDGSPDFDQPYFVIEQIDE